MLGKTAGWVAPEWHDDPFKIPDAKKLDIYSFSKLCAWILFGSQVDVIAKSTSDFTEEALNRLLMTDQTLHDSPPRSQSRKELSATLETFFAQSFHSDSNRRTGSIEILANLLDNALTQSSSW